MSPTETNIVNKIVNKIETAASTERRNLIGDLYTFLGVVEKRATLGSIGGTLVAGAERVAGAAVGEAEKIEGEIKQAL